MFPVTMIVFSPPNNGIIESSTSLTCQKTSTTQLFSNQMRAFCTNLVRTRLELVVTKSGDEIIFIFAFPFPRDGFLITSIIISLFFLRRREKHFENLVRLKFKAETNNGWNGENTRVFTHRAAFFLPSWFWWMVFLWFECLWPWRSAYCVICNVSAWYELSSWRS